MTILAAVAQSNAQYAALAELNRTLVRYDRMMALPNWLQRPLVGSLESHRQAQRNAAARGAGYRAMQLASEIAAEERRIGLVRSWHGRSYTAWYELVRRFESAVWAARATGYAVPGGIIDRLNDAKRERDMQLLHESTN
jgi:hypothetical protein